MPKPPKALDEADQLRFESIFAQDGTDRFTLDNLIQATVNQIAKASVAGEPTASLTSEYEQLKRIRDRMGHSKPRQSFTGPLLRLEAGVEGEAIQPLKQTPPRDRGGRRTPELKLLDLKHSDERAEILKRSAAERKAFASVPRFLCCIAMPASEVLAPPHEWISWAEFNGAPMPAFKVDAKTGKEIKRITRLNIQRWKKWAKLNGIQVPVKHSFAAESGDYRLELNSSPTFGCPYGMYVYDFIVGVATYVKEMQNRKGCDTSIVHFGDNFNDGIKRLIGAKNLTGGKNGNLTRFKHQFHALINSHILWWPNKNEVENYSRYDFISDDQQGLPIPEEVERHVLWRTNHDGMSLKLGYHFHRDCLRAVPIDPDMYRLLRGNGDCLTVAAFLWLNFRAWILKQQQRVEMPELSWTLLKIQFGGAYRDIGTFREKFIVALDRVAAVYPKMQWREVRYGKGVLNARVAITLKDTAIASAYTGFATGTDGSAPRFRPPKVVSGKLFE